MHNEAVKFSDPSEEIIVCDWTDLYINSPVLQSARPRAVDLRRGQNAHCIMGKCRQANAAQDTK